MLVMKTPIVFLKYQRGVMLLEALIAILIFSIGILAIVGLQVNSIKLANDSKYRSDANLLASQLIGEMWMAQSSPSFTADFSGSNYAGGANYVAWASRVAAAIPIPAGTSAPSVTIAQTALVIPGASSVPSSNVTIDIYWSVPGESSNGAGAHRYSTNTQINN